MTTPLHLSDTTPALDVASQPVDAAHSRGSNTDDRAYGNLIATLHDALAHIDDARRTLRTFGTDTTSERSGSQLPQMCADPRLDLYLAHADTDLSAVLAILRT